MKPFLASLLLLLGLLTGHAQNAAQAIDHYDLPGFEIGADQQKVLDALPPGDIRPNVDVPNAYRSKGYDFGFVDGHLFRVLKGYSNEALTQAGGVEGVRAALVSALGKPTKSTGPQPNPYITINDISTWEGSTRKVRLEEGTAVGQPYARVEVIDLALAAKAPKDNVSAK